MRRPDTVRIESASGGLSIVVDRATTYEIVNDLTQPSEVRFELGNDTSWSVLRDALATGTRFQVFVNERPRLKGRLLSKRSPLSASGGATIQATVRTVLADAQYSTAEPKINLRKASLEDAVLAAYEQHGLTAADFVFRADLARSILTGKGKTGKPPVDLQAIKEDTAKPSPPETTWNFVERHLNRFHLTHWDGPDGTVVVGSPDDRQAALYRLRCVRNGNTQANNVLDCERLEDFEEVPTAVWVAGVGGGREYSKSKVQWVESDDTLVAVEPSLSRHVVIVDEALRTQAQAEARGRREMAMRSLGKNAWRITVDGFSYWDGYASTLYAPDTVADVQIDSAPDARGPFLIYRTALRGSASEGHVTTLDVVGQGIWRL